MKTGATSCGRLLAGAFAAGAFVFDSNVVSVPGNVNAPVELQVKRHEASVVNEG